jgi:hypothetical protein
MTQRQPESVTILVMQKNRFVPKLSAPLLMCFLLTSCAGRESGSVGGDNVKHTYSTSFHATEEPISEGGKWINGGTTGRDWGNVQTKSGLVFGTNVSGAPPYDDSTAVLAGGWGSNQMAQAAVYTVNQTRLIAEEVELRLRTMITPHRITGYEFDYRVTSDGSQYIGIVRWNGRLNDFTYLASDPNIHGPGLRNGDTVMATAIGRTLALYINGKPYIQVNDGAYTDGSPGLGFWNWGGKVENNRDYGFTSFTASDQISSNPQLYTQSSVSSCSPRDISLPLR